MDTIIQILARELGRSEAHVENVVRLIDEGNTIPFIARYRKELHGAMDDTALRTLADRLQYLRNLDKRREEVKSAIEGQGKLTEELSAAIDAAATLAEVEDLYRPYKQKRRTRATVAREKGLEPLAELLFAQAADGPAPEEAAGAFIDPEKGVATAEDALQGASDIIAERISDDADIRKRLRADKHGWAVMLHIPRPGRLADPVNYMQMLEIEEKYPNVKLIIAHLGRAYAPEDVGDALDVLKHTKKMMWDFTANTCQYVMERCLETFGVDRFMFGSDLPIFRMKAKRAVENGFYVNVIPKGSLGDVSADPHMREVEGKEAEEISFFLYEEILSCKRACEKLGLSKADVEKIFYSNSARIYGVS